MNIRKTLIAAATLLVMPAAAQAATVDFEAQGIGAPDFISGGRIIKGTEDFLDTDLGDLTAAYTTMPYAKFTNPITIAFAGAMGAVSFEFVNNIAGTYQVTTNTGINQSYTLGDYANQYVSLSGAGITSVAVQFNTVTQAPQPLFDFAIDNVSFSAVAAVPELATWMMMIAGLGLTGASLRRRRVTTAARFA